VAGGDAERTESQRRSETPKKRTGTSQGARHHAGVTGCGEGGDMFENQKGGTEMPTKTQLNGFKWLELEMGKALRLLKESEVNQAVVAYIEHPGASLQLTLTGDISLTQLRVSDEVGDTIFSCERVNK
jgi:hypothetical protein